MATFFLTLRVTPTARNAHVNDIEGALASCWVRDDTPQSALARAIFHVRRYDWDIGGIEDLPTETAQDDFAGRDIALEQYKRAQEGGIAIAFACWAKDGKSSFGPIKLKRSDNFDLAFHLCESKRLSRKGRCLHYDAGSRCSRVIDSHSIQKNGSLSLIADNGHVYAISENFGDFNRNRGGVTYTKQGIGTVSTFRGFCEKHDREVFDPIDTVPLVPTHQQILLYAYRALCREVFVKENALTLMEKQVERNREQEPIYELLESMRRGTEFSLKNLRAHKRRYDESLSTWSFSDIKSVIFRTGQEPSMVFSGLFWPDYDFLGRRLQDLSDLRATLDLLTFSFVPMFHGWGILFAWHSRSSNACVPFMRSLATRIHEGGRAGDFLFRLVISNCENMAMRPQWWESLIELDRIAVEKAASTSVDLFTPTRHDYLTRGMENISDWAFESVICDMD
jgi:hypothetical protein